MTRTVPDSNIGTFEGHGAGHLVDAVITAFVILSSPRQNKDDTLVFRTTTAALTAFTAIAASYSLGCSSEAPPGWESGAVPPLEIGSTQLALCNATPLSPVSALASSMEAPSLAPSNVTDGDLSTRWASRFEDGEWIALDFGTPVYIDRVVLHFEYASSRQYTLQVSDTGRLWNIVYTETSGSVGPVTANIGGLSTTARYIRLVTTERATPYGVSLYEFEAFGEMNEDCSSIQSITSVHSGKALDVSEVSSRDGANVHQWDFVGGDNQRWELLPLGVNAFQLRARHSGKCLDVAGPSSDDGANVHQWSCHGGTSQWWKLSQLSPGEYQLQNHMSGKCLDVADFSNENGGNIQQWSCAGSSNQRWILSGD